MDIQKKSREWDNEKTNKQDNLKSLIYDIPLQMNLIWKK